MERRSQASLARLRWWLWAAVIALLIPAAGLAGFVLGQRQERTAKAVLPILGAAPSYTMTNQLGDKVSSSSLRGKVQVVSFLFPYCTTMCPLIVAHLVNLEKLGLIPAGLQDQVTFVSFNLDPADAGAPQMREFLHQYGWNPKDLHWQYLAGTPAETRQVVSNGFSVWYKRASLASETDSGPVEQPEIVNKLAEKAHVDYDIVHDDVIEIVDPQGRIRKIYDDADSVAWGELLSTIRSLAPPASRKFPTSSSAEATRPTDAAAALPVGRLQRPS